MALYGCLTSLRLGTQPYLKEQRMALPIRPGHPLVFSPTTERVFVYVFPDALRVEVSL